MTRTTIEGAHQGTRSWDSNNNASKLDAHDATRPKGRIRRSMTACNTCRKLKTRCDLDPRSHACRRCLSLRIDCELPEAPERFQDNALAWPEATTAIPCIEERLTSLERSMSELTGMMRQMMDRSPNMSCSSTSNSMRSLDLEEPAVSEGIAFAPVVPKPVHLIRELHSEFFGELDNPSISTHLLGDIVTKGIIDSKLSLKLIQLFVDHFGSWVSIDDPSDIHSEMGQSDPLLFSTACLLASRYMPGMPSPVTNAMYLQVRQASANVLWNTPPLKYEALQALTLLSLWGVTVHKEGPMDSWLLSGISINHAIISFDFLNRVPTEYVVTDEMLKKLRLWNALCLTQLHFAIGNARPLNLQQKYLDHCSRILEHPSATFEDGKVVAEIQLYSITLKLQTNNQRMRFAHSEYDEIEHWKMEWAHLFNTAGEQHCTLELSLSFCQLLLHRTALRLRPESERLLPEIIENARLIITRFLQVRPYLALNLIDHVFFVVGYAAVTLCDFNVLDPLIDQIQGFLLHLSPNDQHIGYRFACVIGELKRRYTQGTRPSPADIKSCPSFEDPGRLSAENPAEQFMSSLLGTIPEGYGALEQLFAGFVPSHALSGGAMFSNVSVTSGIVAHLDE